MAMIERFEFRGAPVTFRREGDGAWFVPARDLANALGYKSHRRILDLFNRHLREFKDGESVVCKLQTTDGKYYKTRVFSPRGCMRVALHADTEIAEEFRDFVLDVMEKLRTGELRPVTSREFAELKAMVVSLTMQLAEERSITRALVDQNGTLAGIARLSVSQAGQMLAYMRHHPIADPNQRELPFDEKSTNPETK